MVKIWDGGGFITDLFGEPRYMYFILHDRCSTYTALKDCFPQSLERGHDVIHDDHLSTKPILMYFKMKPFYKNNIVDRSYVFSS